MAAPLPPNLQRSSVLPADFADYPTTDLTAMEALSRAEDAHFWHRSRNALILERLAGLGVTPPAPVIELGCGGGAVSTALSEAGYAVVGVDGHELRLREAARRAPRAQFWAHDLSRGPPPVPGAHFAAACLFDVIEHLADDRAALVAALALVRPGGLVVGTVPALRALWSEVDVVSGHKRRYERSTLHAVLQAVPGARVLEVLDFNRHLVPLTWLQRRWLERKGGAVLEENLAVPSAPVNALFGLAARVERRLGAVLQRTPLPGASLWFALQRSA